MFNAHTSAITVQYRPRNRNTYIAITPEGEVHVRTPIKDETKIRSLLTLREGWIRSKLLSLTTRPKPPHHLGETVRFRGEVHPIERFSYLEERVKMGKNPANIEKYYADFYKKEAQETLPSRVAHYARKMELHPNEIRFKKMRRRWGSCSSSGIITLNTMMMQLSYEHIDYIIVHELSHLRHMNHSAAFHAHVRRYLPEEKRLRQELRELSPL